MRTLTTTYDLLTSKKMSDNCDFNARLAKGSRTSKIKID